MIKVLFFANIRDITNEKETGSQRAPSTVKDLLVLLSGHYGEDFRNEAFDGDTVSDR